MFQIKNILLMLFLLTIGALPVQADVVEDWGTIMTPISQETSFSFAQYDIDKNFTDQYTFSLEGEAGATYEVSFQFDACNKGCGNPDIAYGIYDANGGLLTSSSGTVLLSSGDYAFQVKGTGFGSGNTVDYWGMVTFSATLVTSASVMELVPPVPETHPGLMFFIGLGLMSIRRFKGTLRMLFAPRSKQACRQTQLPSSA